jgi:hypothetical protein
MKFLTALLILVFSLSVLASSETQTFFYDGTQDDVNLSLRSEETHTEYRYEQRRTICHRQDVDYTTVCHPTPNGTVCSTVPYYRTISYPCIQTVRIPYEVKDYDVDANVNLNISSIPGIPVGETFKVTLDGDNLSISALGSKRFFIILDKRDVSSRTQGTVKFIDAKYSVSLIEANPILKALQVSNISFKDGSVSFKTGANIQGLGFSLNVTKSPLLSSDTILFDRELASNEIQLRPQGVGSEALINFQRIGVELSSGRYKITAKAFFKYQGALLNASQFNTTEASQTLIYKIR